MLERVARVGWTIEAAGKRLTSNPMKAGSFGGSILARHSLVGQNC